MDSILSGLQSARQIVQEGKTRLTAAISNQIQSIASDPGSIIQDAIDPNGITTTTQTTIDDSIANPQPGTTVVHPQTVNVNTDIDVPGPINVAVDTSVTNEQIVTQNQDGTITLTSETTTSQGVGIEGNIGLAEGSIQGTSNTTTSTSITGSPEAIQQQAATGTLPSLDDVTSVPDGTTVTQITTEGGGVHPAAQAGAIGDDMEASIGVETTYVHESGTIESVSAESDQTTVETGTIQTQTHQIQGSAGISGNAGGIESTGQFQDLVEVENVQTQTTSANYPTTEIGDQQAQHQIDEGIVSVGEHGQVTTTTTTSTTVTENNPEFSATLDSNPAEGVSADIGQGTVNIDNEETTTHSHTVVGVSADGNTSPGQPLATENPNIDMIIEDTHTDTVEEAPHQGNAGFTSSSSHTTTYGEVPLETTQATTTDGASIDAQDNDIQQAAQQIVDGDGPLADNPIIQDVANGHSLTESINYDENSFHESFNNGHDNEPAVEAIHGLEDQLNANQGIGSLDNAHNSSMQSASNTSGSGDGSMDTSSTAASSSSSSNTPGPGEGSMDAATSSSSSSGGSGGGGADSGSSGSNTSGGSSSSSSGVGSMDAAASSSSSSGGSGGGGADSGSSGSSTSGGSSSSSSGVGSMDAAASSSSNSGGSGGGGSDSGSGGGGADSGSGGGGSDSGSGGGGADSGSGGGGADSGSGGGGADSGGGSDYDLSKD